MHTFRMSMMSRLEVKRKQLYHASYFNETVIGDVNSGADLTTQYLFKVLVYTNGHLLAES